MIDPAGAGLPSSQPGQQPAAFAPQGPSIAPGQPVVPAQPVGPAPVFGWYIPATPPRAEGQPPSTSPPYGYALSPAYAPPHGYGPPVGYGVPPGAGWGPVRPPSFGKVPHTKAQPYLRLMRTVNYRWWRPVLGLLAFLGCYFVAAVLILLVALAAGMDLDPIRLENLTDPAVLALTNASLIVAIPSVWVAWAVHTERIGWSSSVLGRIRWRLLWRYGLVALVVLGLSTLIGLAFVGDLGTGSGFDASSYSLLVLVVVFSTPLQSAAEEYVFRGYLSQAISSWIPSLTIGAVLTGLITATLFSLLHLPGDFLTFFDRFAFGLAASAVVWLTGGLEAAIALHAANNVCVFLLFGALGDAPSSDIEGSAGNAALLVALDVLVMGLYVWIVARTGKRWHPETVSLAGEPVPVPPPGQLPGPAQGQPPWGWGAPASGWARPDPGWGAPAGPYAPAPHGVGGSGPP